jgi:ethanolamine transporter EutH
MSSPSPGPSRRLRHGLFRALRGLGLALALGAAVALVSLLIVYPLWYFSSRFGRGYTVFVLAALAALILFLIARRLQRQSRRYGGFGALARHRILPALRVAGIVVGVLAGLYGIALLIARILG